MDKEEKKKLIDGVYLAVPFILIILIIKLVEISFDLSFASYGLYPRRLSGLPGIILTPLLHKDLMHLFNNAVPLFVSIVGIFYFYRKVSYQIFIIIYLVTQFLIWIFARDSYHIGASGLVYGLMAFLFFASAFSNNKNMLALSLILIFAYGAMFWGILPVENNVSWESHLIGAIVGFGVAIIYRKQGPKPEKFDWEDEEDDLDEMTDDEINELIEQKRREVKVKYWYRPKS